MFYKFERHLNDEKLTKATPPAPPTPEASHRTAFGSKSCPIAVLFKCTKFFIQNNFKVCMSLNKNGVIKDSPHDADKHLEIV